MFKKIVVSTLMSAIIIGLSGCGGAPKPVIKQLQKVKPMVIEFPKVDPITLKEITIKNLDFSNEIVQLSKYRKYKTFGNYNSLRYSNGVKTNKYNTMYSIKYIRRTDGRSGLLGESIVSFNFMYEIKNNTITFKYPSSYKYLPDDSFIAPNKPVDKLSNLENDSKYIFSRLNTLYISKKFKLSGEINSNYPAQSIYANFKRMVGNYSYRNNERITESKKQNTFNLKVNGKKLPLYVEVFPYREGSKVKYSTTLPYKITQNGSSLTKQNIEDIKTQIFNIINN
jgi:hypothetical protein